jgi:hypothetical protein
MSATPFITVPRDERLSRQEICRRHPERWVVLAHIDWQSCSSAELRSAVVVSHAVTRNAALDAARPRLDELGDEFACFNTKRYIFWMRPSGLPGGYV